MRLHLALWPLLLLASCGGSKTPSEPPSPALWEVTGQRGEKAWLFGTVHALPENIDWQTPAITRAVASADELVLELGKHDQTQIATVFTQLSRSHGLPPLSQRVPAAERKTLLHWMDEAGIADAQSGETETWAAALMIAQAIDSDKGDGVEQGLLAMAKGKPVVALEGARAQLGIFDGLPEQDQRDLLMAVLDDGDEDTREPLRLALQWRRGDMEGLAAETRKGLLADKELRHALLENRNLDWAGKIEARLKSGRHSFVAAGAAHMAGSDGVPSLLKARGWQVRRLQ